jgi:hypothetical protein
MDQKLERLCNAQWDMERRNADELHVGRALFAAMKSNMALLSQLVDLDLVIWN